MRTNERMMTHKQHKFGRLNPGKSGQKLRMPDVGFYVFLVLKKPRI